MRAGAGHLLGQTASVEKGDKPFNCTNPSGGLTQGKVPSKLCPANENGSELELGMYQLDHLQERIGGSSGVVGMLVRRRGKQLTVSSSWGRDK